MRRTARGDGKIDAGVSGHGEAVRRSGWYEVREMRIAAAEDARSKMDDGQHFECEEQRRPGKLLQQNRKEDVPETKKFAAGSLNLRGGMSGLSRVSIIISFL